MNLSFDPFEAGPRLTDTPHGDAGRQAVDALRGYAFQLYGSALAWLGLNEGEDLYLEVAEDYAVAAADALRAVQAKDTEGSGPVTLNSSGVKQAIESLVDLTERNPQRAVYLRYLSTSPIGVERASSDRVEGMAGLLYWSRVAQGNAGPLRRRLSQLGLTERATRFIDARSDDALRNDLIARLTWDCGCGGIDDIRAEIEASLSQAGRHGAPIEADELGRATSALVEQVLMTAIEPAPRRRRLTPEDRARTIRRATYISLPSGDYRKLMSAALGGMVPAGGPAVASAAMPGWLILVNELPLPRRALARGALIDTIEAALRSWNMAVVSGGTGMGKSVLTRLTAERIGGDWLLADLRDMEAPVVAERLASLLGQTANLQARGVILDDLDAWEDRSVDRNLALLCAALRRHGRACLVTTHHDPVCSTLEAMGADAGAVLQAPYLTASEAAELIALAGGDGATWGPAVHLMSGGGPPATGTSLCRGPHGPRLAARGAHGLSQRAPR